MLIQLAIRDPALEALVRDALDRLGFASAAFDGSPRPDAAALVLDERHPAPPQTDFALPTILLGDPAAQRPDRAPLRARRVWLRKPFTQRALAAAVRALLPGRVPRPARPIAHDASMRQLAQQLEELAGTPLTLVLSGETGTGKTHWARWIHGRSPRAAGPLVEVSPGTSPCGDGGDLLGEVADAEEPGPFEASDGGTLLVEEVPELTRADQLALLRFLIERSDARGSPVDARVVVTTRRGLARETAAGRLHPELAARLSAVELRLPPLRERPGDLRHFARELAARIARAANATPFALDERAFEALERLALPGNLHELQNLIERWTLLGLPADAARSGPHAAASWAGEALDLRVLERRAIARALELSQGNRALAARALGVHARTLRNKLRERSEPR